MKTATTQQHETVFIPSLNACSNAIAEVGHKGVFERFKVTLVEWNRRHRTRANLRRQLWDIDAYRAEMDVGLPVGSLLEEARKPFWKA